MKQKILETAVSLARTRGYPNVYKHDIARLLGCSEATVNYHWQLMTKLRTAVMVHAIKTEDLIIIAQGLINQHPLAVKVPRELKQRAVASI